MPGANYMGGKRNAAKAKSRDSTGRAQKGFFARRRLEILGQCLGPGTHNRPDLKKRDLRNVLSEIGLAHAKRSLSSSTPVERQTLYADVAIYTPSRGGKKAHAGSSSTASGSSKIIQALDESEPLFIRAQMDRILKIPDLAGLPQRRAVPLDRPYNSKSPRKALPKKNSDKTAPLRRSGREGQLSEIKPAMPIPTRMHPSLPTFLKTNNPQVVLLSAPGELTDQTGVSRSPETFVSMDSDSSTVDVEGSMLDSLFDPEEAGIPLDEDEDRFSCDPARYIPAYGNGPVSDEFFLDLDSSLPRSRSVSPHGYPPVDSQANYAPGSPSLGHELSTYDAYWNNNLPYSVIPTDQEFPPQNLFSSAFRPTPPRQPSMLSISTHSASRRQFWDEPSMNHPTPNRNGHAPSSPALDFASHMADGSHCSDGPRTALTDIASLHGPNPNRHAFALPRSDSPSYGLFTQGTGLAYSSNIGINPVASTSQVGWNILDDPDPWSTIGRILDLDPGPLAERAIEKEYRTHDRRGVGYVGSPSSLCSPNLHVPGEGFGEFNLPVGAGEAIQTSIPAIGSPTQDQASLSGNPYYSEQSVSPSPAARFPAHRGPSSPWSQTSFQFRDRPRGENSPVASRALGDWLGESGSCLVSQRQSENRSERLLDQIGQHYEFGSSGARIERDDTVETRSGECEKDQRVMTSYRSQVALRDVPSGQTPPIRRMLSAFPTNEEAENKLHLEGTGGSDDDKMKGMSRFLSTVFVNPGPGPSLFFGEDVGEESDEE